MPERKLTPRQARFVDEYLIDLNATQAAIRAGYSEKTAYSQGQRLLKKVEVAFVLEKERQKRAEKVEIDQEWVIKGLIQNIEFGRSVGQAGAVNRTYELLGKHLDMFTDKHEITGKDGAPLIPALNVTRGKK